MGWLSPEPLPHSGGRQLSPAKKAAKKPKMTEPHIVKLPARKMAVVHAKGEPGKQAERVFPALYGSAYMLKFQRKRERKPMEMEPPAARWPDAHLLPKEEWTGIWALPVPSDVRKLPQKVPEVPVKLETWRAGPVAQILHIGPYDTEPATIQKLHEFIAAQGYEIAGDHEEVYLTSPRAKVQKTLVRYAIRKRS